MRKYANLVDLEKCCKMSIWLQRLASIQKRTSLSKFAKNPPKVRKKVRNNIGQARRRLEAPRRGHRRERRGRRGPGAPGETRRRPGAQQRADFWQPLRGSFSSVSKPIFATKYAFCSIFFFFTMNGPRDWEQPTGGAPAQRPPVVSIPPENFS